MSATENIKLEAQKLLESEWSDNERELISRLVEHMMYYRRLIPDSLKQDILAILTLANRIKNELVEKSDFISGLLEDKPLPNPT